MPTAVILGCGYTGSVLARLLVEDGWDVRGTTTRPDNIPGIRATGAQASIVRLDQPDALRDALAGAEVVFHLAPPPDGPSEPEWAALEDAVPSSVDAFVYGSTTGAFGAHPGHDWIDEDTPTGDLGPRGARRYEYERGLEARIEHLRVVRIAGIYGPGRTIWTALQRPNFVLFEGGPPTSRTHVEDLALLLKAMSGPHAPALAVACDEAPTPTLDVARFTCAWLGVTCPDPVTLEEAQERMSAAALEMRLGGRRCRSKVRPELVGPLRYPTYETGVVASLIAEGFRPVPDERQA